MVSDVGGLSWELISGLAAESCLWFDKLGQVLNWLSGVGSLPKFIPCLTDIDESAASVECDIMFSGTSSFSAPFVWVADLSLEFGFHALEYSSISISSSFVRATERNVEGFISAKALACVHTEPESDKGSDVLNGILLAPGMLLTRGGGGGGDKLLILSPLFSQIVPLLPL